MNLRVALLQLYQPAGLQRAKLEELFRRTAAAFAAEPPPLAGLSFAECRRQYALFTRQQVEQALQRGDDLEATEERLYQQARQLGAGLRASLRITAPEDAMAAAGVLYRALGIDFHGTPRGAITIRRCFFSDFYSPRVCRAMSAVDSGVIAGLAGGGRLVFRQRLTEGYDCCRACLVRAEGRP